MAIKLKNKFGQEEMVGFALIIILVSVILLAFLGFYLTKAKPSAIESYEVENFIQASFQYTTNCSENSYSEYFSIEDLIFECDASSKCSDGRESCGVLNSTLNELLQESWPTGEESSYKGYKLMINTKDNDKITNMLNITKGSLTGNYKGANQPLSQKRKEFSITFNVYS